VDGETIEDPRDLVFATADEQIGAKATLAVWRDGARKDLSVTIGRQPGGPMEAAQPAGQPQGPEPQLGASVTALTPELRAQLGLPDGVEGLAVLDVASDSAAAEAGLGRGDVIVEAAGQPVRDADVIRAALEAAKEQDRPALLQVFRDGSFRFVAVSLPSSDEE
jgi:serine protease Do